MARMGEQQFVVYKIHKNTTKVILELYCYVVNFENYGLQPKKYQFSVSQKIYKTDQKN